MKNYNITELRNLGPDELQKELTKGKQEVFRLSFTIRTGAEKNTSLIKKAKLYVAQINTVINSQAKI
ncbi:MAG: 50S ribosomal protein L29 [Candidatus Abawacabacteria bacterium RBG_16_42_10]|uniref:Large ribosomal subunit protein uL29 n=2 Tax=Bacteria TaxID=2 RepID=A0A0H4TKY7_9BACT|nr:hypothetical protein [uncultured bacterium Rifle_16ft_4_minimus_15147]OGC81393.1 MAG: 50S ribosomal protein L29 [Candidatus Abawacabacteria bacterium RBG_16_42_10]